MTKYQNIINRTIEKKDADRAALEKHLYACRAAVPIIEKFNGKVINKRFETALREAGSFRLDLNDFWTRIETTYNEAVKNNRGTWTYTGKPHMSLNIVLEDKRLNAEETLENMSNLIHQMEKSFVATACNEVTLSEQLSALEALDKQAQELLDQIDSDVREVARSTFYRIKL